MNFDLYYKKTDLFSDALVENELGSLSQYRQSRVMSFENLQDKNLCLCASLLLKQGLAKYNIDEKEQEYAFNDFGKPYLKNHPNIHFSLSHSGEYAAAAFSDREIGCDIQKTGDYSEKLVKRFFTSGEAEHILNSSDAASEFFRVWTFKESFIKTVGRGLSISLSSFEILNLKYRPYVLFENKKYCFAEKEFEGYKLAVCSCNFSD